MNRTESSAFDNQLAEEFERTLETALDSVPLSVFLCGKALKARNAREKSGRKDLRLYLQVRLENEFKSCRVRLGEHRRWMQIYGKVVRRVAFNLADYEIALASKIDLLVIFPCSPGSFAELGMFSVEDQIAEKMVIFLDSKFRKSRSYVVNGSIAAAKRRKSTVFVMKYSERQKIWGKIRDLVLKIRANKGKAKLLT